MNEIFILYYLTADTHFTMKIGELIKYYLLGAHV